MRKLNTHQPMVHWREIPLVRLLLPFLFGIYLAEALPLFPKKLFWSLPIFLAGLYWLCYAKFDFGQRWQSGVFISFFFFLLAYVSTVQYDERQRSTHFKHFLGKENLFIGQVNNYPYQKGAFIKVNLKVEQVKDSIELLDCTGNLLVYLKTTSVNNQVEYGDKLLLKGVIGIVPSPKNPHSFDYANYLHYQNIHYQGFIDTAHWSVLVTQQAPLLLQEAHRLQNHFLHTLKTHLTQSSNFAIASAMTLGYKEAMTDTIKTAYSESGAIHVLAISGLHVGILSEVILYLLGLFAARSSYWRWSKYLCSLLLIWAFVLLVGATDSVVRAGLMFSFLNFGRVLRRDIHPFNSLAAAAFIILLMNPYALFQIGFQFSFLAVSGIFFFYKHIHTCWTPNSKVFHFFWQLTAVGISAQLTVTPLSIYYFHQLPTYALLSGLFVVPFATGILYLSLSLLVVHTFSTSLAAYIAIGLSYLIELQNKLIFAIQQLPFHVQEGIWLEKYEVLVLYLAILCLLLLFFTKRLAWLQGVIVCLIFITSTDLVQKLKHTQQQQLVIYATPKEMLIDFIAGTNIYTWASDSMDLKKREYAAQTHRWAVGMQAQHLINKPGKTFESATLWRQTNHVQFGAYTMVVIDKKTSLLKQPTQPLTCELLLLKDNPKLTITELAKNYQFDLLIFTPSNTRKSIAKWKISCEEKGIPYYDVGEEGAFVLEMED